MYGIQRILSVLLLLVGAISLATAQTSYSIVDLGTLGGDYTYPYGINDTGQVVGYSYGPGVFAAPQAAFWSEGSLVPLTTDTTIKQSKAFRVNKSRIATGYMVYKMQPENVVVQHAFVWNNGVMTDIDNRGGLTSNGAAINESGVIVGSFTDTTTKQVHTFRWQGGTMTDLGTFGGTFSGAVGINTIGQIVGNYTLDDSMRGYLYSGGGITDLGSFVYPEEINDRGDVVGNFRVAYGDLISRLEGFIYQDGAMIKLGDPTLPETRAMGINDRRQVVGYTTQGIAFLWEKGVVKDLNTLVDPGFSWTLSAANGINEKGQIICEGYLKNFPGGPRHALLLTPLPMGVYRPAPGDLVLAGTRDTIRWINGIEGDVLTILFSSDSGKTYTQLADDVPAERGYFAWDVPEGTLSVDCFIALQSLDDVLRDTVSGRFRVKGYQLTRFDTKGKYDPYVPAAHGWGFGNGETDLWPETWWNQFDYAGGLDPNTAQPYPHYIQSHASPKDFIDWPLFVSVFGVSNCFFNDPHSAFPVYRPSSVLRWVALKSAWGGSCFGMATASFMAFEFKSTFQSRHPGIGAFTNLSFVSPTPAARLAINGLWAAQWGSQHAAHIRASWGTVTPTQTVSELKAMFLDDTRDDRILTFANYEVSGAHAVNPYMVKKKPSDPNVELIYVYDNNHPGATDAFFSVDLSTNIWRYNKLSWYGTANMFLMEPVSNYFYLPEFPKGRPSFYPTPRGNAAEGSEVYVGAGAAVSIHDTLGGVIAFADSTLTDSLPGASPIIPITGGFHAPIGYRLPAGGFSIQLYGFTDSLASVTVFSEAAAYRYSRSGADPSQTDILWLDEGLSVRNIDSAQKTIELESLIPGAFQERDFRLSGLVLGKDDSVGMAITGGEGLRLSNHGSAKKYTLNLRSARSAGESTFLHVDIPLVANSTQEIAPDWENPGFPLRILIDLDADGEPDDSMTVANEATGVRGFESERLPNTVRLRQNYPNPFNPRTTITYELPKRGHVELSIYDLFGREVATLVDGEQEAGVKSVTWDASEAASGVYVARLQAEGMVLTQKLLLVK